MKWNVDLVVSIMNEDSGGSYIVSADFETMVHSGVSITVRGHHDFSCYELSFHLKRIEKILKNLKIWANGRK